MRIIMRRSFILLTDTVSTRNVISSLVPPFHCGRFQEPIQVRSSSCVSDASLRLKQPDGTVDLRHRRQCSLRHSQMRDFLRVRVTSLTNGPLLKRMSTRPILPESIPLSEEEKMTLVKAEYELYKAEGEIEIPSQIEEKDYKLMAQLPNIEARKKHLWFLYTKELRIIKNRQNREINLKHKDELHAKVSEELKTEEGRLVYGLWRNNMFINYPARRINNFYAQRLFHAKVFGQPIIFDYGLDAFLTIMEKKTLARQMIECIGVNRTNIEPYYIHMCNFRKNEDIAQETLKRVPKLLDEDYPIDTHAEDYLDLFPKEKLVYITPNCRDEILKYDHNAIYIIGGILKLNSTVPFVHAKIKEQGIKMKKLPYDRYLNWRKGSKSLPLNQVLGILLEVKRTGNWMQAFEKYVPQSRLTGHEDLNGGVRKKTIRNNVRRLQRFDLFVD
ncbi:tRNA methyltransferase TRMD/TRM10-type domain [Trinorchestia longiramus]|nr:tRNA methyltransferase TRMD/TRM10-type domain [Trinorchestia longiramus]